MDNTLIVSSSPHLHCGMNTRTIMLDVLIALAPAGIASVWLFGWRALLVELICVASAMAAEVLSRAVMKRPQTVGDLSCVVTGLLLAYNLPSTIPLWQAALGSVVAIVVAKQMFGGLGQNFVNPALLGRIVLMGSFPGEMNNWVAPMQWQGADAISSATPLALMSQGGDPSAFSPLQLFVGMRGGCLGVYIGTVFVMTWLLGGNPLYHILSGGLMLGAIFMATDYTTSPINKAGKVVFAVGCGLLTVLIRLYGSLPEGVSFAIVIMNILVPLIERVTRPRPFGEKRRARHE